MPLEHASVRLHTATTAQAADWPDVRMANVAAVLTWALFDEERRDEGLGRVPLLEAQADLQVRVVTETPVALLASRQLVKAASGSPYVNFAKMERGRYLWANPQPVAGAVPSTNAVIREVLGLEPRLLATAFYKWAGLPPEAYAQDPEEAGRRGLNLLMRDVLRQYWRMDGRCTDEVRLMAEHDALDGRRPDAKSANVATLLSAALTCEDGHQVRFFPARSYSHDREKLLRALAADIAKSGARCANEGFEMICDDMIHHDPWSRGGKGRRLLREAYDARFARTAVVKAFQDAQPTSERH